MTTTTATSSAQIVSQLAAAAPGDRIEVTSGTKSALSISSLTKSNVTVAAQDPDNPPVFAGSSSVFVITNLTGVTFDGLTFLGTADDAEVGAPYPAGVGCKLTTCHDIAFVNCTWDRFMDQIQVLGPSNTRGSSNLSWSYCRFTRCGRDNLQIYRPVDGIYIGYNVFEDQQIYEPRQFDSAFHPDPVQFATLSSATIVGRNYLIERNYFSGSAKTGKGPYLQNEKARGDYGTDTLDTWFPALGYSNVKVKDNYVIGGRTHGIVMACMLSNCEVSGNIIRKWPGSRENATIGITGRNDGLVVSNNVTPVALNPYSGGSLADCIVSGNVVSSTAVPSGWVPLVPGTAESGGNCGPYAQGTSTPTIPTQPLNKYEADGTTLKDGGVANYYDAGGGLYGPVLIIPDKTPAAVAAPAYAAGLDPTNFRWKLDSDATIRPFELGNPSVNGSGSNRFNAVPGDGSTVGLKTAGLSLAGFRWSYRLPGAPDAWSLWSDYSDGFTAPGTPPATGDLAPLEAGMWEFVGSVYQVLAGPRFTQALRIIPDVGPTYTGLQWDLSDGVWRNLLNTGIDGDGAILWELMPSAVGGFEHTVQYGETINTVRLRWTDGVANFSPPSLTAKGFTGPVAPSPISPFNPEDWVTLAGAHILICGFPVSIPAETRPAKIPVDDFNAIASDGTITVSGLPALPPSGASGMRCYYAGKIYPVIDGGASFPEVVGQTLILARAFDDTGRAGPAIYGRV